MPHSSASGAGASVIVIGAGVAGLGTALVLSRDGHRVTLVERDATPLPADADAAFEWDRRGAPQVRHSHAMLARLRNLLRDRYPDVLDDLLRAGVTELRFAETLPEGIADREPRAGDEDLVALACRRTTFEWVLRRCVLAAEGVTLLDGFSVESLVAQGAASGTDTSGGAAPPRVTGARLRRGREDERVLSADMVVAAVGRRSAVPRWLAALGIDLTATEEDTGIVYLSRFYRLRDGCDAPPVEGPIGGDLGYLKYAVFQGDNRTFSVTFATATRDGSLRARLVDPAGFDLAAANLPATASWVEPGRSEATTQVQVMGGLVNRRVEYLDPTGRPVVSGFHAVGDAHTCTNPLYGRGCSLAMVGATLLSDALLAHPVDPVARSVAYEAATEREIRPWYDAAVAQDRMGNQSATATSGRGGGTAPEGDGAGRVHMREVLVHGLMPAVRSDATVYRAFVRAFNLLDPPDALLGDADVVRRVMSSYAERELRPPEPPLGPDRGDLMAVLAPA